MKLSFIIEELVEEKSMNRDDIINSIIDAIKIVCERSFPESSLTVNYNKKDDILSFFSKKTIVKKAENDNNEISIRKASSIIENAKEGDEILVPFVPKIGRIDINKIKHLISQKIREIEAEAVYKEFSDKIGTLVNGVVHKIDSSGAIINIYDYHAYLPNSLLIPEEKLTPRMHIRCLIKEVYKIPKKDEGILLERTSTDFIKKLLEIEIPEIFEKIVIIENIVRIPGYKTKVVVSSKDKNINPVGTCIGQGGIRIKQILRELGNERLDILKYNEDKTEFVIQALKPAKISSVEIKNNCAYVKIEDEERSAALGKGGKNIVLASKIVGIPIEIIGNNNNKDSFFIKDRSDFDA
jgi:N utilization substance protein A